MRKVVLLIVTLVAVTLPLFGASYHPFGLDDPKAVYLTRDKFVNLVQSHI